MESFFKKKFYYIFILRKLEGDNLSTLVWKCKRLFGECFNKFFQGIVWPFGDDSLIKKSHFSSLLILLIASTSFRE